MTNKRQHYQDIPPKLLRGTPRILEHFMHPRGLLALNLARCEYGLARANGCSHDAALDFVDAELDAIGLGGREDVGAYVSADYRAPMVLERLAA